MSSIIAGAAFSLEQLMLGFLMSFLGGLVAIYLLLKIVEKVSFWPFVLYLIGLAAVLVGK
jgi:undecaprenyl pyrophosphate phosphatase UppP